MEQLYEQQNNDSKQVQNYREKWKEKEMEREKKILCE